MKPAVEKLGIVAILTLGMPSGVYMLNECVSWKFQTHGNQVIGTTHGGGNRTVVTHLNGAPQDSHTKWITYSIRHSVIGSMICKLKGIQTKREL